MEELLHRFRQAASEREGLRYPQSLRQLALEYAALVSNRGGSRREIAASLGLPEGTLSRWQKREVRPAAPPLHEVVIVEPPGGAGPVLRLPSGAWVEGLSVGELVTVLRSLG